jgi:non-specific serine/threonine protein kinase
MREHCFIAEKSLPPLPSTSLLGREWEALTVAGDLHASRLLTLTGVAGCGKSRLALQVASSLSEHFARGVYWVELATLSNPAWLPRAIATVCEPDEPLGPASGASLARLLGSREALLVLNNCEHLIASCSALVELLLHACPHLRILVTSREALNLAGETIRLVPVLPFPAAEQLYTLEELRQLAAVQLFVERATAVQPAFEPTPEQVRAIAQICQRLDGVPLAIEMAAVRLRVLSPEQIAARLDDCCQLLTTGYRTALPHHRSLAAAMDWSYNLLSDGERGLLQDLSALPGSASLEAIEQACGHAEIAGQAILDVLASLVNKSLVVVEDRSGQTSYHLLEMQRQYVRRLAARESEQAPHERSGTRHLRLLALGCATRPEVRSRSAWLSGPTLPPARCGAASIPPSIICVRCWEEQNGSSLSRISTRSTAHWTTGLTSRLLKVFWGRPASCKCRSPFGPLRTWRREPGSTRVTFWREQLWATGICHASEN